MFLFSLTLALVNSGYIIIDYTMSKGMKLFRAVTYSLYPKELYPKEQDPFACNAAGLKGFVDLIKDRSYSREVSTTLIQSDHSTLHVARLKTRQSKIRLLLSRHPIV